MFAIAHYGPAYAYGFANTLYVREWIQVIEKAAGLLFLFSNDSNDNYAHPSLKLRENNIFM